MSIPPPVRDGARRSTPCLHADGVGTEVSRCSLRASVVDANNTAGTLVCSPDPVGPVKDAAYVLAGDVSHPLAEPVRARR